MFSTVGRLRGVLEAPRIAAVVAVAVALLVFLGYGVRAWALICYPWDWSPDEGLFLDYARRVSQNPRHFYTHEVVPYPCIYTPLFPIILAPFVLGLAPLFAARLLCGGLVALVAAGVYALVRQKSEPALALAAAALILAPFDLSFWLMLIRPDALMIGLWLASAAFLLPSQLAAGADRLDRRRIMLGSLLLLASVLSKPTAILHGAPLVLGWLLVDRRSAVRLALVAGVGGLLALLLLQALSGGAFLWVMSLYRTHDTNPSQLPDLLLRFLWLSLPVVALAALGLVHARRAGLHIGRDAAWLLVAGGLFAVPALAKAGAWWNYLLPALCATVVLLGRLFSVKSAARSSQAHAALGIALVALFLATTRTFPLPDARAEATARSFYSFVQQTLAGPGGRLLATHPDYAYFLVGQEVEAAANDLAPLARAGAPGIALIRQRLEDGTYRLVITVPWFFPEGTLLERLKGRYKTVGACALRFFWGTEDFRLWLPVESQTEFRPPPGTACAGHLR